MASASDCEVMSSEEETDYTIRNVDTEHLYCNVGNSAEDKDGNLIPLCFTPNVREVLRQLAKSVGTKNMVVMGSACVSDVLALRYRTMMHPPANNINVFMNMKVDGDIHMAPEEKDRLFGYGDLMVVLERVACRSIEHSPIESKVVDENYIDSLKYEIIGEMKFTLSWEEHGRTITSLPIIIHMIKGCWMDYMDYTKSWLIRNVWESFDLDVCCIVYDIDDLSFRIRDLTVAERLVQKKMEWRLPERVNLLRSYERIEKWRSRGFHLVDIGQVHSVIPRSIPLPIVCDCRECLKKRIEQGFCECDNCTKQRESEVLYPCKKRKNENTTEATAGESREVSPDGK